MQKWIRWQGLGVFVGVVALPCIFWFLFIDGIVKGVIQKYGSEAVGAKVELRSADLSLFPAGLELKGLKIANPDEPMKNAVEIARTNLNFDTLNFFRRKVIVEQMTLDGIRLNTPRKTSGALPGATPKKRATKKGTLRPGKKKGLCGGKGLPALKMPNVTEVLSKEKLPSLELVTSLKEQIEQEKQKWQQRLASLPDEKTFQSYKGEIQKIRGGGGGIAGMLASGGKAMELKKKIEADLNRIKQANADFQKETSTLKQKLADAKKAPFKDAARLAQKYGFSKERLANMSQVLFGAKICTWMEKATNWYEKIRPILERAKQKKKGKVVVKPLRGKGAFVKFKEHNPMPDFLIKKANASIITGAGDIMGIIKNITPDQDVLALPLTFSFKGDKLKNINLVEAKGALNHTRPQAPKDEIRFLVKGFKTKGISLLEKSKNPIILQKALADLNIKALVQGQDIKVNVLAAFHSASFSVKDQEGKNPIMEAIFSALKNISNFIVNAKVIGTLEEYDIKLSSDLDGVLKKSAGKIIAKQTEQLRQKLSKAIMDKVNGPLSDTAGSLSGLNGIQQELSKRLNLGSGLLGNLGKPGGKKGLKLPFS